MYQHSLFAEPVFTGRERRPRPKAVGVQGTLPGTGRAQCPVCGKVTWWQHGPHQDCRAYLCEGCGGWIRADIIELIEEG